MSILIPRFLEPCFQFETALSRRVLACSTNQLMFIPWISCELAETKSQFHPFSVMLPKLAAFPLYQRILPVAGTAGYIDPLP
jgi:hypothetical protein